ncbi:MAG TPA: RagB/SusD family nutrient uptake outer membrane protein [Niastella sp.]
MKRLYNIITISWLLAVLISAQTGCKKLVDPNAPTEKIGIEDVYTNDKTAASVLTRLLGEMSRVSEGLNGYPMLLAISADDLKVAAWIDAGTERIYFNSLRSDPTEWWSKLYNYIYTANDAMEQLPPSTGVSEQVKNLLLGEARFVRAYSYFYLVNTYGGVPLVLTTDYRQTSELGRTDTAAIYNQIITDLTVAKELLSKDYLGSNMLPTTSGDRLRPVKATAAGLLARVYLYTKEYAKAEAEASEVIANTATYGLVDPNLVFRKNSKETIWQLPVVQPGSQTLDGMTYILRKLSPSDPQGPTYSQPYLASDFLLNTFETGDLRKTKWIGDSAGYKFINKYKEWDASKPIIEATMMMRLGEQYLIRAEARVNQEKIADGIADLNVLRQRARGTNPGDLPALSTGLSKANALLAVEHERQVELFTEWGHRWFDLKRTGRMDAVMSMATAVKSSNLNKWESFRSLWPIPAGEILNSPGLTGHQNQGY